VQPAHASACWSRRRFDAAVIFTVCTQSALPAALLCRMAGIPLRLAHSRENPYDLLTHWVRDTDVCATGMRHEVTRQLDLVRTVGFHAADERMQFRYPATDVLSMRRKLVAGRRPTCCGPTSSCIPGATAAGASLSRRTLRRGRAIGGRSDRLPGGLHRLEATRLRSSRSRRRTWLRRACRSPAGSRSASWPALIAGRAGDRVQQQRAGATSPPHSARRSPCCTH
jgi:hypothetical protein